MNYFITSVKQRLLFIFFLTATGVCQAQWRGKPVDFSHGRLQVSANRHFLQHEDGRPFFWMGDTAWRLLHRLTREEAAEYLTDRAKKGYTVIQIVALNEENGKICPSRYGFVPVTSDPASPVIREGPDNDFWDYADEIIDKANEAGLYTGFLPTWGTLWHSKKPLFNPDNAYRYGLFLGKRYRDKHLVWILGGDDNIDTPQQLNIIRAMAKGLRDGDEGRHLITFHPRGASGSAQFLHNEQWLDFNMRQNGHSPYYTGNYSRTLDDYRRTPPKPVIDGEPLYEAHPIEFNAPKLGHSIAADIRRALYWDLFCGACGHTYGHHSVWQFYMPDSNTPPHNNPLMSWRDALDSPGARQMLYGRLLMESRPFLTRLPDPSIIAPASPATSVPGEGLYRFAATRDEQGTYAMVYAPVGRPFTVNCSIIKGDRIKAWWFNPRTGEAKRIGVFANDRKPREFVPPDLGEALDWILILDNADCHYPAPGIAKKRNQ
ncbi:MAG: glycoside hydrolase family 140 protein [Bacteroidales bacterium]|nr:glycoside hydrolase family 140 protein [Bacteroidales bacterium]